MRFELAERTIDLWHINLSASDLVVDTYEGILSPDEAAKSARFRFDHLRRSYVLTHGALRLLLGHYLGIAAANVRLWTGQRGKPEVVPHGPVRFNLSHSGTKALIGFTRECEIGVDLERMRTIPDLFDVAARSFCAEETAELMSLSASEREVSFFRCWTRKEAYLKAVGDGLYEPLDSFRVSLLPGVSARLIHIKNSARDAGKWTLHDIDLGPNYCGAVAHRGAPRAMCVRPRVSTEDLLALSANTS